MALEIGENLSKDTLITKIGAWQSLRLSNFILSGSWDWIQLSDCSTYQNALLGVVI